MDNQQQIPTLSVVIPVYNEERTIEKIFLAVSEIQIVKEIIIIDDSSEDQSVVKIQGLIEKFSGNKNLPSLSKFVGIISENIDVVKSSCSSEKKSKLLILEAISLTRSTLKPSIVFFRRDFNKIISLL